MRSMSYRRFGLGSIAPFAVVSAFLLLANDSSTALGQVPAIEIPGRGAMPTGFLKTPIRDSCESVPAKNPSLRPPWKVWIAAKDFRPLQQVSMKSKPVVGSEKFKFLESCHVMMESQPESNDGGNHEFLLVGRIAQDGKSLSKPLGWVPRDYVIESERSFVAIDTCIPLKRMIINDVGDAKTFLDDNGAFQTAVWMLSVPQEPKTDSERDAYRLARYELFRFSWVYARSPAGTPTPEGRKMTDNAYLLLGKAPSIDVNATTGTDNAADVIIGWVPESRTIEWLTREGYEWDQASTMPSAKPRRIERGSVYRTAEDSWAAAYPGEFSSYLGTAPPANLNTPMKETFVKYKEYLEILEGSKGRSRIPAASSPTPAQADGEQVSVGYEPNHPRFLNLSQTAASRSKVKQLPSTSKTGNELLRVGAVGGTAGLTPAQIADRDKQIEALGELLTSTEILFVIDDTISMGKHFPVVADAVESIVADAQTAAAKLEPGRKKRGRSSWPWPTTTTSIRKTRNISRSKS